MLPAHLLSRLLAHVLVSTPACIIITHHSQYRAAYRGHLAALTSTIRCAQVCNGIGLTCAIVRTAELYMGSSSEEENSVEAGDGAAVDDDEEELQQPLEKPAQSELGAHAIGRGKRRITRSLDMSSHSITSSRRTRLKVDGGSLHAGDAYGPLLLPLTHSLCNFCMANACVHAGHAQITEGSGGCLRKGPRWLFLSSLQRSDIFKMS